jgi:hypothetical protein
VSTKSRSEGATLAEDQHMVEALTAKRPREPLRERVRPRRPDRRLDHPRAVPGEDSVERRGELAVPVTDQEPEPAGALAEVHEQVAGLLGSPASGRMGGNAQDVHGPGLHLHDEQDVHTPQQHGIDMQEVAGQDAGRLAGQELPQGQQGARRNDLVQPQAPGSSLARAASMARSAQSGLGRGGAHGAGCR